MRLTKLLNFIVIKRPLKRTLVYFTPGFLAATVLSSSLKLSFIIYGNKMKFGSYLLHRWEKLLTYMILTSDLFQGHMIKNKFLSQWALARLGPSRWCGPHFLLSAIWLWCIYRGWWGPEFNIVSIATMSLREL